MPLKEKITSGDFIVLGEFEPPKGSDFAPLLAKANLVKGRLNAIVVPEMANGVMKAGSLGGSAYLRQNGFEPIMQVCCRDRNRLALQADILSAEALGITNIMAVPGDDIAFGDHHEARAVNDLSIIELLECIGGLQNGRDMAGVELSGSPPHFLVGSSFNAGATGGALDAEISELEKKIQRGLDFIITTPIFDLHRFQQVLKRVGNNGIPIIPAVLLLKSAGMARYVDRNVKHISIPEDTIQSIQKASDKVRQCIRIAGQTIALLKDMGLPGVMISTIGWEDRLPQILDESGI